MRKRPPKREDVLGAARRALAAGRYRDTRHSMERRLERVITIMEARDVIHSGWREPARDEWKAEHHAWTYAIRGRTIDGRALRIAISFEADGMLLIITAIDLDNQEGRP